MDEQKNEISISVVFQKTSLSSVDDISYWEEKFEDKILSNRIDYDKDWTEELSRVEFKGVYKGES